MYIHGHSAFISSAIDDIKFYKQEISRYTDLKFRRASKFVLLSLLGARQCAHGHNVRTDTGVYLATENGNLGDTETVLDQLYNRSEFPMPYNFINTMSNTASFCVAQSFDIVGRNFTLSSKQLAFERSLELLSCDLATGVVTEALFGGVDEACFSQVQFEAKFHRAYGDYKMVEGSCWLLVKAQKDGAIGAITAIKSFSSLSQIGEWLQHQKFERPAIAAYGLLIDQDEKELIGRTVPHETEFDYIHEYGYFDTASACGVTGFLSRWENACLVHVNKDFRGQYVVVVVEKY